MWNNDERQQLADIYAKLCGDMAMMVGTLSALEIHLEGLKKELLEAVQTGCGLGQCLEALMTKYPIQVVSTETTYMTPSEVEAIKLTLPRCERRETYIDTRGLDGKGTKEAPRQGDRQTETFGDDGAAD